jgi:hypothetical protein
MDKHRRDYKSWKDGKASLITSFNLFETYSIENCEIILLESVNVNSKDELLARESYWIKLLDCVNKVIPNRTRQEYYNDNKEKLVEKNKQYYEDNKEKLLENKKQYYEDNKEKLLENKKQYYEDHKENKKQYYEDHKDNILEKRKQHYEKNKQDIAEQRKQTYICIACNTTITLSGKSQHEKTKKHTNNVDSSK